MHRLFVPLLLLTLLHASVARAQIGAPEGTCTEGPAAAYATGASPCRSLSITLATIHAVCTEEGHGISCRSTLEAAFRSIAEAPVPLPMGELFEDPSHITALTVDGAPWTFADPLPIVQPGQRIAVHVETLVTAEAATITAYSGRAMSDLAEMPPIRVRHFLIAELGAGTRAQLARIPLGWLEFTRRALGWHAVAIPEIDVEAPEGWAIQTSVSTLAFSRSTADVITNGGPVVAAGGTFDHGARVGVGYELGFAQGPTSLVLGLHGELLIETQLRGILALQFEIATPSFGIILPSFSTGIGLAVQVAPTAHAGLRIVGGITWPIVGTNVLVDIYDDGNVQVSWMGRISI